MATGEDAPTTLKVGELAVEGGVTVRTLHHYEEIGLLVPGDRTAGGHRVYAVHDRERLARITTLRRAGLSLGDIASVLGKDDEAVRALLERLLVDCDDQSEVVMHRRSSIASALEATAPRGDLIAVLTDALASRSSVRQRISIIVYRDLVAAHDFLHHAFDFVPAGLSYDEKGAAVHGEMHAGDGLIWLHPEAPDYRLFSAATLGGSTSSMAVMVDDVDRHHTHASTHGATIVYEPVDQPYGYREYSALDSEGGLWSFMKKLEAE